MRYRSLDSTSTIATRPHAGMSCPVCNSFFNVLDQSDKPIFDDTGPRLLVALSTICGECDTSYKVYCEATNVTLFESSGVTIASSDATTPGLSAHCY